MSDINHPNKNQAQNARKVRRIVMGIVLVLIVLVFLVLLGGYLYVRSAITPMDEADDTPVEVEIPSGATVDGIGAILEDEDLIANGTFFRYYARYHNATDAQAGIYELNTTMNHDEILEALQAGPDREAFSVSYTIPEGLWVEDIAETIAEETDHDEDDVMALLESEAYAEDLVEEYSFLTDDILHDDIRYPLEGYLFPAMYEFVEEDTSLEVIVESMVQRTAEVYDQVAEETSEESDPNPHDVLTLAAIVEREAQTAEDRRLIAGVLFNRLEDDMQLEVDPTVAYAQEEHLYMTSLEDIDIDHPFNTYQNSGLPPGPIASPGEDAIRAIFEPEETDYLFFYARVTGEVIYSETFEEHEEVHETYRDEWIEATDEEDGQE